VSGRTPGEGVCESIRVKIWWGKGIPKKQEEDTRREVCEWEGSVRVERLIICLLLYVYRFVSMIMKTQNKN
jgi:hypothetical protein